MHYVVIRMNSPTFYLARIEWKFLGMLEEFQISIVFVFLTCTTFPSTVARFHLKQYYTFMAHLNVENARNIPNSWWHSVGGVELRLRLNLTLFIGIVIPICR